MKVKLITYTHDAEKIISAAAKLCYSPVSINEIMTNIDEENSQKFVKMLSSFGHESPIEHVSFTFGIEGISRACLAQLTRHRIASYSVQSQRYVREDKFEYVTPPEIKENDDLKQIYDEAISYIHNKYIKITNILKEKHYKNFIKNGDDEKTAASKSEKKAIEDARFLLPNACNTKMILTMNARSLKHFFELRCCNRAQWEIRNLACEMLKLVKEVAPTLFFNAGPKCVRGECGEGKMSCGKAKEVREKFLNNILYLNCNKNSDILKRT